MTDTPKGTNDLVALAERRSEREREKQRTKEQARLAEARKILKSVLAESHWAALGIDPEAAVPKDSGVVARGSFSHEGENYPCEAYASTSRRGGVKLTVDLGHGFVVSERLGSPHYTGDETYQEGNAAEIGSLIVSLPAQKALAAEKRAKADKKRLEKALSKASYAFNTTYSASYLRESLARSEEFREGIPEETPERKRLEEMISAAKAAAEEMEASEAARERRVTEVLGKAKSTAAGQLAAVEDYDERCRRYAAEQAEEHFFAWAAQEVRYCPAFTAQAIAALASSATYHGPDNEAEDEYAGTDDALREALVDRVVAVNLRAAPATEVHEPGTYLLDSLGYDGTRTPLVVGAFLDSTEISFPEHDLTRPMSYHRSVNVGNFYVNVPAVSGDAEGVLKKIAAGAPEKPASFEERLREAGVPEEDLELLPYEQRNAVSRGAYRFLAGVAEDYDPYDDPDLPY